MTAPHPEGAVLPPHRPLSDWIARVLPGEPGQPPALGRINDGDERADARFFPRFRTQPWTRTSAVVERAGELYRALALRAPDGHVVVELDDHGAPVPVSEPGTDLVAGLEERWADPPAHPEIVAGLHAESLALRYFLLHRLTRETLPPPGLFHCLPWERVDAAARSATARLHAETTSSPAVPMPPPDGELRHWFTPAASSLAGPLQVLEAGLRTERTGPWFGREAAHLLSGLHAAEPARLPTPTRHALAGLVDALGEADRALRHSARLVSERLTGLRRIEPIALTRHLDSDFVLRASSGDRRTGRTEFLEQWPVAVGLTVTGGGLLEIEMEVEDHPVPPFRRLTDGALCHPVTLRSGTDTDTVGSGAGIRYWMVLDAAEGMLHGFVAVTAPAATFEVHLDAPPVPLRFLDRVPREELEASLTANERVTLSQWHRLIDGLPPHHPAHAALTAHAARRA
ncbi:hypothetical protein ACFU8I_14160 [Streptomyces sp. NPDC057540]|uniref:hypothetical protein n=1 Tax=Streptomyces sp. NPDC057540 TaxID=3346160 RepID=UPI0036CE1359